MCYTVLYSTLYPHIRECTHVTVRTILCYMMKKANVCRGDMLTMYVVDEKHISVEAKH